LLIGFFICLHPIYFLFWPALLAWWFSICISRLLLYRHHILDVVGGIVVGFLEAAVMAVIWIGPETAKNLVKWISDDRVAGNDAELI
jgi:presqualene diphosphate phosphatase